MQNENCRFNAANVGATESSYVDIPSKSESALQAASATIGPISVAMDASHLSFQVKFIFKTVVSPLNAAPWILSLMVRDL